jgi:hypothetical protein
MMPQHARVFVEQTQRGDIGAAAAPQRRRHGPEQLFRVQLCDDGIGDIEEQIELIALALKGGQ